MRERERVIERSELKLVVWRIADLENELANEKYEQLDSLKRHYSNRSFQVMIIIITNKKK